MILSLVRLCFALLALGVHSTMAAENPPDPRIAEASRLYAAQEFDRLQVVIDELRSTPEPHLEALFLSGMLHARAGRHEQAAAEFRLMLARDPRLVRARLELALALQNVGDRQGAKYHYEQVLAADLPEPVKRNITRRLFDIREREPSVRLTLELSSDSNPKQATQNRVVYIGGLPYTLNDNSRAETVWGLAGTVDAHLPLPADPSWFAHAYGEMYEYPGQTLDSQYVQAAVGKRVEWGQHRAALELGGHAYRRTGGNQYDGGTARATGFLRLSPRTALTAEVSVKTLSYAELPYLTGSMRTLGTTAIHVPEPTRRWEAGLGFTRYQATEAAYTYNQPSATVRAVQEWAGGWISGLRMQALVAAFAASDPFFGEIRRDREIRIEFDLLNRKLKWWSMSPRLLIGFVRRESNLDLYDYKRSYARIGLTREF